MYYFFKNCTYQQVKMSKNTADKQYLPYFLLFSFIILPHTMNYNQNKNDNKSVN